MHTGLMPFTPIRRSIAILSLLVAALAAAALQSDQGPSSIPAGTALAQLASAVDGKNVLRHTAVLQAPDSSCFAQQHATDPIAREAMAAAVFIRLPGPRGDLPRGSGFLVRDSAGREGRDRVITAAHVLAGDRALEIIAPDGTSLGLARPVGTAEADDVAVMAFLGPDPAPGRLFQVKGIPITAPTSSARVGAYTLGGSTGVNVLASGSALVDRASGRAIGVVVMGASLAFHTSIQAGNIAATNRAQAFTTSLVRLPKGGLFWAEGIPHILLEHLGQAGRQAVENAPAKPEVDGVVAGFPRLACMVMDIRGEWMKSAMPRPRGIN